MAAVERDRPLGAGPGPHEHRALGPLRDVIEQRAADASALAPGPDVRVPDQVHLAAGLDAHHAEQLAVRLVAPEDDAVGDLALDLGNGHVGLVPAVGGDDAAVGLGGGVDDRGDRLALGGATWPDRRAHLAAASSISRSCGSGTPGGSTRSTLSAPASNQAEMPSPASS